MARKPDPDPLSAHVRAGHVIAGKYRVERVLGRGGMGLVVAAKHLHLGEQVAIKLIDFGISKITFPSDDEGAAQALTDHGAAIGTPHYMAPEQMRSAASVDARADIWSLVAVLYGLLTGSPPFAGGTMVAVYDEI